MMKKMNEETKKSIDSMDYVEIIEEKQMKELKLI